jgi:protein-S-isoprenylcysteine O-methyltransferase Ste14
MRLALLVYGLVAYLLFIVAFTYGIGFVGNLVVPKGIDDGPATLPASAVLIDVLLLGAFAVQHNIMARPWFKEWWTQFVPRPIERATFVAASSLLLVLLYWQWRPLPGVVWHVENGVGRGLLWVLFFLGWGIVLYSSALIDHFELFGLRQAWLSFQGRETITAPFSERSLYRWVRHPLMFGFILAFWSAPTMTWGRLLFAVVTTVWILIAIQIEERDLATFLGEPYREYRRRTPMMVPWRLPGARQ